MLRGTIPFITLFYKQMMIKDMGNTLTLLNSHVEKKMKNTRR